MRNFENGSKLSVQLIFKYTLNRKFTALDIKHLCKQEIPMETC